jgi:hypothetical protein
VSVPELELVPVITQGQLIERISIGGVNLDLAEVTAAAVIRFGRVDPADAPISCTLSLTLLDLDASQELEAGDLIQLDTLGAAPRFRGQITDLHQSWSPDGALELVAVGSLGLIARRRIGYGDWPQEPWSARVARVFSEASWTAYTIEKGTSGDDPPVAARLASETTVENELGNLAVTGSAAIVDLPDGSILVQTTSARRELVSSVIELPPELVLWAPDWTQSMDVVNVVDAGYGTLEDPHTISSRNTDSVARFGERSLGLSSTFALAPDAAAAGAQIVNRRGYPHWSVPTVQIAGMLTPRIGALVRLTELPPGSPMGDVWQPVVEGWTDTLTGDVWSTMLQVSDPIRSGVSLRWMDTPSTLRWMDVSPSCRWSDASSLGALTGALI